MKCSLATFIKNCVVRFIPFVFGIVYSLELTPVKEFRRRRSYMNKDLFII